MTAPTHFFVDTSVLESKSFNLGSQLFQSLAAACAESSAVMVLPACIEDEITRRMTERGLEALKKIGAAARTVPYLPEIDRVPSLGPELILRAKTRQSVRAALQSFFGLFEVERLDHSEADMVMVMRWYDSGCAPFGRSRKKHEFPDAVALSSLLTYARRKDIGLGIVSLDGDFRSACEEHHELLYFGSLDSYAEALLSPSQKLTQFREALEENDQMLSEAIWETAVEIPVTHAEHGEIEGTEVVDIERLEWSVILSGESEFTISWLADIVLRCTVSFDDPDSYFRDSDTGELISMGTISGDVRETVEAYGLAKFVISDNVLDLVSFEFEPDQVAVRAIPSQRDWDWK